LPFGSTRRELSGRILQLTAMIYPIVDRLDSLCRFGTRTFALVVTSTRGPLRQAADNPPVGQATAVTGSLSGETCMNAIIDADIFLVVVAVIALGLRHGRAIDDLRKRTRRLGRIEAKLDLLMRNASIEFRPYEGLPAQVAHALNRGEKIEAIKILSLRRRNQLEGSKKSDRRCPAPIWVLSECTAYRICRCDARKPNSVDHEHLYGAHLDASFLLQLGCRLMEWSGRAPAHGLPSRRRRHPR
jgi:hypothetical protein